ncbi:hypothetical protein PoB_006413800 [Plakobranchus ocellatus]|uniref:Uncharacterized protein n=1 Tax=Plakobranchus ocellatus TaxID=259542 RepID=A0AAV4D0B8_9GAST|nr:hypothetical protein PoB_006413800 [Plakobranchus ocellatus]
MTRACLQQGDLRLSGPLSGQGTSIGTQPRDGKVSADLRVILIFTVSRTSLMKTDIEVNAHYIHALRYRTVKILAPNFDHNTLAKELHYGSTIPFLELGSFTGSTTPFLELAVGFGPLTYPQGDLRLLGPPSGQCASGGTRTHDRKVPTDVRPLYNKVISGFQALFQARARTHDSRVPSDLRADSLSTVPPTPLFGSSSDHSLRDRLRLKPVKDVSSLTVVPPDSLTTVC